VDAIVSMLYWVQLTLLVLAVVAAVVGAVRGSGPRAFVPWRAVVQAVLAAAVFAVAFLLAGAGSSILWTAVLIVLGAALGYLLAGGERLLVGGSAPGLRRSAVAPWVWALSLALVALTLLFGSTFLYGVAVLVMAFALGLVLGQITGEFTRVRRAEAGTPAPAQPAL
jgi:hypothetical protein